MDTNTLKIKRNVPLDLNRNSMMRKGAYFAQILCIR